MPNAHKEQLVSDLRELSPQQRGDTDRLSRPHRRGGQQTAPKLREDNAEYHIVKNTLFKVAMGGESPGTRKLLTGRRRSCSPKGIS